MAELLLVLSLVVASPSYGMGATATAHVPPRSTVGSVDTLEPGQLVALLYLRRFGEADSVRAELYPVALLTDEGFVEARAFGPDPHAREDEPAADPDPPSPTVLDSIRRFTVYEVARPIGRFDVREEIPVEYACTAVRVGTGELDLDGHGDPFDEENPRLDVYWTGEGSYGLSYFLALSRHVEQQGFARDTLDDPDAAARLREQIRAIGVDSLAAVKLRDERSPELSRTDPVVSDVRFFDLDQDGRWEATGRVTARIEHDIAAPDASEPYVETFDVSFAVWVADRGPETAPRVLLAQRSIVSGGAWGEGLELVEVMDLDGDGTADPFYEWSGWESNQYVIYRLVEDRLEPAFRGSGYGC